MAVNSTGTETVTIYGRPILVKNERRQVDQLRLNPDNPRLRHELLLGNNVLTEQEIADLLWNEDRTKKLYQSILGSGGIQNPLWIYETGATIEGNRRVVVARKLKANLQSGKLTGQDASVAQTISNNIPVKILPGDIGVKEIDVLLAREHISGKYPWPAVDQAEHIHRMAHQDGFPIETIAEVTERSRPWVYQKLTAFEWTRNYLRANGRASILDYSYFEELYKVRASLKKNANFDPSDSSDMAYFQTLISSGKIPMAIEVRHLPDILADADAKRVLENEGVEKAWIAISTKNPAISSPTFQAISAATEALQTIPRNEYLDIPQDSAKKKLIFELSNELDKLRKDLKIH
jgi:hypothetical protein